ncbi:choice-of-anchor X domain-containing protein [Rubrivirga sp.]|uniref:choice-of-anchor X domain-containing protein n=1 Tax=Rubrivirga sp. TaxID=1885344 RepID=UPI003B527044
MPVALRPVVALVALTLAGCDAAPGFADEVPRPALADVALTPTAFALDTDAPRATVPLAVTGTLDAQGPVEVRVLVRYAETDSLVTETVAEVAGGAFRVEAPVVLPRGAVGPYSVRVTTEGADGRAGDQASAVLDFAAANLGPPTVVASAPGSVARPAEGRVARLPFTATVTDPDGRENVRAVVAVDPETGGVIGRLFDDGEESDATADDGRYTAVIEVTADFEPGTYALDLVAIDRAGAQSEPAPYAFTVR